MEKTALDLEVAHIGINAIDLADARDIAGLFNRAFGFELREGTSSIFAGGGIEVMKAPFRGRFGHIALRSADPESAMRDLELRGYRFDPATMKRDKDGRLAAIYLEEEMGGFAVHLLRKTL